MFSSSDLPSIRPFVCMSNRTSLFAAASRLSYRFAFGDGIAGL
jgi:hypothetical protein